MLHPIREFEIISPPLELKNEFGKIKLKFVYFLRNSDFINNATRLALCIGARYIFSAPIIDDLQDAVNLPDIHPKYLRFKNLEINKALEIMNESKIEISFPFIELSWSKKNILKFMRENFEKIDLSLTRSCYNDTEIPCGKCRACITRKMLNILP